MPAEKSLAVLVREAEKSLVILAAGEVINERLGRFPTLQSAPGAMALVIVAETDAQLAEVEVR